MKKIRRLGLLILMMANSRQHPCPGPAYSGHEICSHGVQRLSGRDELERGSK